MNVPFGSQVEGTRPEKIRLFIRVNSVPLVGDLYEMLQSQAALEIVGEATEADIILAEVVLPKEIFGQSGSTNQMMIQVQDLANYLALSTGVKEFLKVPLSGDELAQTIQRVYRLSLDHNTMGMALKASKTYALGRRLEISLSVTDLSASLIFYEKLGLKQVDNGQEPYPWVIVSDETLHLGLHQQPFPSPTLTYFSWGEIVSRRVTILKKLNINFDRITTRGGAYGSLTDYLFTTAEFTTPEGQCLCLANTWRDMNHPQRSFFARYDQFGELSLKTADVKAAVAYWEQLGFQCIAASDQPYPWATVSDGLIRLGFHQTPKLIQPTITYFAPDMPDRLKHLQRQGIKLLVEHKDEKGQSVGAVIDSPDGQRFYLFTGELRPQMKSIRPELHTAQENRLRSKLNAELPKLKISFNLGQKVRIVEGPFADFMGTINEVDPDRACVKVQISFFGQEKLIEFDFLQVEHAE